MRCINMKVLLERLLFVARTSTETPSKLGLGFRVDRQRKFGTFLSRCGTRSCILCGNSSTQHRSNWLPIETQKKWKSTHSSRNTDTVYYISAAIITMLGAAYAGVPLYRMFCAATGIGGQTSLAHDASDRIANLEKVDDRILIVRFNADVASSMQWNFRPQQTEIRVAPGETALAFYTACNPTDKPIIGISTYSVIPYDAGQYFNKIQCFCFEEQILNPHEEVDMPVFFYIDPEYVTDPRLQDIDEITLSYTFFEAKDGMSLPLPGFPNVKVGHG